MKKHIVLAAGLAVLSTSAFATKARMGALGQGSHSFYLKDSRNVFYNPAKVNSMNNYVVTEWGTANDADDSAAAPHAEGGFFREAGAFAYGVYFGNQADAQNGLRAGGNGYAGNTVTNFGSANFVERTNDIDLFFGGDMGVEWGVNLHYAKANEEATTSGLAEAKNSTFGLGLGVVVGDLEFGAKLGLNDESENFVNSATTGAKWEADTAMNIYASHKFGSWTGFGEYNTKGAGYTASSTIAKNETSEKRISVGAGHVKKINASTVIVTDIRYNNIKAEDKDGTTATNNVEKTTTNLPVTFAFETDATSWLTFRGSVSQSFFVNSVKTKTSTVTSKATANNTTTVAAGATLNFGNLKVDGYVGSNGGDGTAATGNEGALDLDRLLTKVSVHYWF